MAFIKLKELYSLRNGDSNRCLFVDAVKHLISLHILPTHGIVGHEVVLDSDLNSVLEVIKSFANTSSTTVMHDSLFPEDSSIHLMPSENATIIIPNLEIQVDNSFYSGVRHLFSLAGKHPGRDIESAINIPYFYPTSINTTSSSIKKCVDNQLTRARELSSLEVPRLANTAHYMGSKRAMLGFIVEAMSHTLPENGVVLDLMCGSGSASAGFSRYWPTFASDSQLFCGCLAKIQGGGFNQALASDLIDQIIPHARDNVKALMDLLKHYVAREEVFLHSDVTESLVDEYIKFHALFPTYPDKTNMDDWDPTAQIMRRKSDYSQYPYCLFTSYFANMFLGIRQSIEVDSIRYGIDQIENNEMKLWALGALVSTVSSLASTYGGHFAQPPYASIPRLNKRHVGKLIEKRAYPITQEFCVRLMALAKESEMVKNPVEVIEGPWQSAFARCEELLGEGPVGIYLDAPYTRDEYSRYYHVLETLVKYNYPSVIGKGRLPDKKSGERFKSEFFTRVQTHMEEALIRVISGALMRGWNCLWSYADSGSASVPTVIEKVMSKYKCTVRSYVAPHQHQSHRGRKPKNVLEYLISFKMF